MAREVCEFSDVSRRMMSKNVIANVAKSFLRLIDKRFTTENNLRKVFNKNCVKVTYRCTESVSSIINSYNKNVSSQSASSILS